MLGEWRELDESKARRREKRDGRELEYGKHV